jgi:branched-chain amino acid transport system ATP-binding protein
MNAVAQPVRSSPLLQLEGVASGYGSTPVLKDVNLTVQAGEVVAVLGSNGAGKSTLLLTISQWLKSSAGRITFCGEVLTGKPAEYLAGLGISHVPEGRRILPHLTVLENLELGAYVRRDRAMIRRDLVHQFERFPILAERRRQLAGTLSGGEQQMLAIARGLMSRPKLLMLDEPSLGLAPKLVQQVMHTIQQIHAQGVSILLVEQNAAQALGIANRAYVLESGTVRLQGEARSLRHNPEVVRAYLGE